MAACTRAFRRQVNVKYSFLSCVYLPIHAIALTIVTQLSYFNSYAWSRTNNHLRQDLHRQQTLEFKQMVRNLQQECRLEYLKPVEGDIASPIRWNHTRSSSTISPESLALGPKPKKVCSQEHIRIVEGFNQAS